MSTKTNLVCVIEDVKPIRKLFCTILQKAGYETVDFPDGKSSLEWLKSNEPLCVLIDILLPDINGTEICKYIREKLDWKNIPVIAVTGFAQANDRNKFLEIGFDEYISKPINTATFASEIQNVLKKNSNIS